MKFHLKNFIPKKSFLYLIFLIGIIPVACNEDDVTPNDTGKTMYDDFPEVTNEVATFEAQGNTWKKSTITWSFHSYSSDLPESEQIGIIDQAFHEWEQYINLSFVKEPDNSNSDIQILWANGDHGDGIPFDGSGKVLAHAFFPPPNKGDYAGDCHFDEDENWDSGVDLLTVAIHEIGHSLGLSHSDVKEAIMYPFYSGRRINLHDDDITGIQLLYPRPEAPKWYISYSGNSPWIEHNSASENLSLLRAGDFDGDGKTDIFTTVGGRWFYSKAGVSAWQQLASASEEITNLGFGDFDGDGKTDVFTTGNNEWFFSSGGIGSWQKINDANEKVSQIRFGDFDGDGKTDIFTTGDGQWFFSPGGIGSWQKINTANENLAELGFGDFDGDGKTDVFTTGENQWFLSSGGTGPWQKINDANENITELGFGDFDGDGKTDVFTTGDNQWFFSSGGTGPWQKINDASENITQIKLGDFDGDGKTDIFTTVAR